MIIREGQRKVIMPDRIRVEVEVDQARHNYTLPFFDSLKHTHTQHTYYRNTNVSFIQEALVSFELVD